MTPGTRAVPSCPWRISMNVSHVFERLLRDGLCLVHLGRLELERLLELLFLERVCPLLDSRLLLARVRARARARARARVRVRVRVS